MSEINHGTYGGWYAHRSRGEQPCRECADAKRDYMRAYREQHPEYDKQGRKHVRTRP